jgi:hypothetical protein
MCSYFCFRCFSWSKWKVNLKVTCRRSSSNSIVSCGRWVVLPKSPASQTPLIFLWENAEKIFLCAHITCLAFKSLRTIQISVSVLHSIKQAMRYCCLDVGPKPFRKSGHCYTESFCLFIQSSAPVRNWCRLWKLKYFTTEYQNQHYSLAEHSYVHFTCFKQITAQCAA